MYDHSALLAYADRADLDADGIASIKSELHRSAVEGTDVDTDYVARVASVVIASLADLVKVCAS